MKTNAPAQIGADEAVRQALEDLSIAGERGNADGVSAAAMSRAIEVSAQQMARILKGERFLHPGQIARLPGRAFAAAMGAIHACRATPSTGTVEGSLAAVLSGAGEWISLAGRILGDGHADAGEQVKATIALQGLRDQIDSVLARLAIERGNVAAIGARR